MRRITRLLVAMPAIVLTMAMCPPSPRSVPLPDDFSPEGIAAGMKFDRAHHRLWVAGGPTGHAYV